MNLTDKDLESYISHARCADNATMELLGWMYGDLKEIRTLVKGLLENAETVKGTMGMFFRVHASHIQELHNALKEDE